MIRTLQLSGLGPARRVAEATITEALDEPVTAQLLLAVPHDDEPIVSAEACSAAVVLELLEDASIVRAFHLQVVEIVAEGWRPESRHYRLKLVERFARLALRRNVRIFQNKTSQEIVRAVFEQAGIAAESFEFTIQRSLPKRAYCVQYRESDLDFVRRLLAGEGIFSIPADDADQAKRIFTDRAEALTPIDGESELELTEQGEGIGVEELEIEYSAVTEEVVLSDWNYETPGVDLTCTARASDTARSSRYEFPGGYDSPAVGKELARIRLEEHVSGACIAHGRAQVSALRPGRTFTLSGATRAELCVEWLVRRVVHHYSLVAVRTGGRDYVNHFEASPQQQPYRPARRAERPVVAGLHSIKVTGPSGEEIHTDALGRMKGKFFWDREAAEDDQASCWIRVVQLPIGGSQALARVGWEMMVRYAWGDPDRPIAVCRVDNGAHTAPYTYPAAASAMSLKTLTSPGAAKFNEFTMEDGGGGMKFGVTASKDYREQTNNDKTEKIGVDEKLKVGTDLAVTVGSNQSVDVGGSRSCTVASTDTILVSSDRTKTVGASETVTIARSLDETIGGSDSETVGASHMTVAGLGVSRTCSGSHSLTVGGVMISAAGLGCGIAVAGSKSETTGAAKLVLSGSSIAESVYGAAALAVGGAVVHIASENRICTAKGSSNLLVGGVAIVNAGSKFQVKAESIKMVAAGTANFIGGGGIVNLTPGSATFLGLITVDGSSAVKVSGSPNLVG